MWFKGQSSSQFLTRSSFRLWTNYKHEIMRPVSNGVGIGAMIIYFVIFLYYLQNIIIYIICAGVAGIFSHSPYFFSNIFHL